MVDFNDKEIKIGSTVFWMHRSQGPIMGIVSNFKGPKTFFVKFTDVIKFSRKGQKWYDEYLKINKQPSPDNGYIVISDNCIVID